MTAKTNLLVSGKKLAISSALALTAISGGLLAYNHGGVHAAAMTASPLDDRSVAALTSLDSAMEALASRVSPAVVNIAVTSRVSAHEASMRGQDGDGQGEDSQGGDGQGGDNSAQSGQDPMADLPPQLRQFFGQQFGGGGGRGMQMQPQQPQLEHGIGSGVVISPDGYIVTNNHVVDGATEIRVTLNDRRIYTGHVVGVDKLTDLAVVKINAKDLPAISWGDSGRLEPGQTVLAFGSPFGYFQNSVTRGIVSAVNRQNPYSDDARKPGGFIQTDAAINPGNSGGALVNAHGELVGINTFIISNSGSFAGAGFAIPAQIAHAISQQIIAHGKVDHGYLGISLNDVTPDNAHFFNLPDATGAIVAQVSPDSPASKGGLRQGDVIVRLNGSKILNAGALQVSVSEVQPGTSLEVGVLRNGQPVTLHVTAGEYHAPGTQVASSGGDTAGGNNGKLGLAVADVTPDTRQRLNLPESVNGAVVRQVRPGSPAEDAGLQPGDVVLEVNRKPAGSANQFVSDVRNSPQGQDLLLLVWSHGNSSYRTVHPAGDNG